MARTWQVVASAAAVGLALAVVSIAAAGPWEGGQRTAERAAAAARDRSSDAGAGGAAAPEPAADVLTALGTARDANSRIPDLPPPTGKGLEEALLPLLKSSALGSSPTAAVVDAATGKMLFGYREDQLATPASTIKIATAVAALDVLGSEHRIPTVVVPGAGPAEIVLVGRGDPTLTARDVEAGPEHPASLRQLARDTARGLKDRRADRVRLLYDTSAYSGPVLHPIGVNENLAPVTALMVDEGRQDPASTSYAPRVADPAADAAKTFAELLEQEGVSVAGIAPGTADKAAEGHIAEVRSLPVRELVERALTHSDNDIAEALARQTALALGRPASFEGASRTVTEVLTRLGVPTDGAQIHDGSGLNSKDALSAELLAKLLAVAASPERPELRPVLSGLPVAGFTGTLSRRFQATSDSESVALPQAAGLVRAKTGTLTGVNTLAGTVVDADGRLLTFAFMAQGAGGPAALDRLAATLANCGCR